MQRKRFRDTLWFKKGALDDEARQAAARGAAAPDGPPADGHPDDPLPVDERYLDDGSVTSADSLQFSVRTGRTQALPRTVTGRGERRAADPVDALVRELGWQPPRLAVIGAGLAAIGLVIALLAR